MNKYVYVIQNIETNEVLGIYSNEKTVIDLVWSHPKFMNNKSITWKRILNNSFMKEE